MSGLPAPANEIDWHAALRIHMDLVGLLEERRYCLRRAAQEREWVRECRRRLDEADRAVQASHGEDAVAMRVLRDANRAYREAKLVEESHRGRAHLLELQFQHLMLQYEVRVYRAQGEVLGAEFSSSEEEEEGDEDNGEAEGDEDMPPGEGNAPEE